MRFVPRRIEIGKMNQKIETIAIFHNMRIERDLERFTETESMISKNIRNHSKTFSKYIMYCPERSVLRIFA